MAENKIKSKNYFLMNLNNWKSCFSSYYVFVDRRFSNGKTQIGRFGNL